MHARLMLFGTSAFGIALAAFLGCGGTSGTSGVPDAVADGGDGAAGSSGSSGSPGSTSGVPSQGGVNPSDAGPGGTATSLACGTTACAIPAQTCCVEQVAAGLAYSCSASGSSCASTDAGPNGNHGDTVSLKCSGAANCPAGSVCCVQQVNSGATSECKASCGQGEAQLCDPNAAPTGCAANAPCSSKNIGDWSLPSTYATCGGKGN